MTRAKKILYLTFAGNRLYFGQRASNPPSRFIIDIPENLLKDIGISSLESITVKQSFDTSFDDIVDKYLSKDDL